MTILNVELDPCVAMGFTGGPEWNTRITGLRNGHERRNAQWANPRHRWTAPFANISSADYLEIKRVFNACRGQAFGFLFQDRLDYQATNESLGVAPSGTTAVQLVKVSTADGQDYTRTITRPIADGFVLYQSGTPKAGTLDSETGLFTPTTSWSAGEPLTWTGEFLVPVRFAADWLPFSIDNRRGSGDYAINGSVDIVEVFGE
jgi:uncharacterized protein (TIGR02217 family)